MPILDDSLQNWLPWQHPLNDRKTNPRLTVYTQLPTNSKKLVKIGPAYPGILTALGSMVGL